VQRKLKNKCYFKYYKQGEFMAISSFRGEIYEHRLQADIESQNAPLQRTTEQEDISGEIASFLKGKDLFGYVSINKGVRTPWNLLAAADETARLQREVMVYPRQLIKACGGMANVDSFPILTLTEEQFRRPIRDRRPIRNPEPVEELEEVRYTTTDYIDFLQPKDFANKAPTLKGVDPLGRPFIAFAYWSGKSSTTRDEEDEFRGFRAKVEVVFSRYEGSAEDLRQYTSSADNQIFLCAPRMGTRVYEILDRINRLITRQPVGQPVQIDDPAYPGCSIWVENPNRTIPNGESVMQLVEHSELQEKKEVTISSFLNG
jgi:hypothetical protein